jgi:hypothetical protein
MHVGMWGLAAIVIVIASWLMYQRRVPMFIPRSIGGQHPQEA